MKNHFAHAFVFYSKLSETWHGGARLVYLNASCWVQVVVKSLRRFAPVHMRYVKRVIVL